MTADAGATTTTTTATAGAGRRAALWWLALVAYGAGIYVASSTAHPPGERLARVSDKGVHAAVFAGMSALACMAARASFRRWSARATALFGFAVATLYGALDEVHQAFTPGRSPDVRDALADALGAAVAAAVFFRVVHTLRREGEGAPGGGA